MRKLRNGKPPKRTVEVDAAVHRLLKQYAEAQGMKLLVVVERAIKQGLATMTKAAK